MGIRLIELRGVCVGVSGEDGVQWLHRYCSGGPQKRRIKKDEMIEEI